jgi:hypothetical protein
VLAKISQIHLLSELCSDIVVPNGVVAEINVAPDDDPAKLWMANEGAIWIRDVELIDPVIAAWDLGLGESHVFTWAYQHLGYQAILDDRAAKTAALAFPQSWNSGMGKGSQIEVILGFLTSTQPTVMSDRTLNYLPRIGKYIRKKEIIPKTVPTVLVACVNTLFEPNVKVAARTNTRNTTVPIIEIKRGVVLIKIALALSLNIGVSTKLVYL